MTQSPLRSTDAFQSESCWESSPKATCTLVQLSRHSSFCGKKCHFRSLRAKLWGLYLQSPIDLSLWLQYITVNLCRSLSKWRNPIQNIAFVRTGGSIHVAYLEYEPSLSPQLQQGITIKRRLRSRRLLTSKQITSVSQYLKPYYNHSSSSCLQHNTEISGDIALIRKTKILSQVCKRSKLYSGVIERVAYSVKA